MSNTHHCVPDGHLQHEWLPGQDYPWEGAGSSSGKDGQRFCVLWNIPQIPQTIQTPRFCLSTPSFLGFSKSYTPFKALLCPKSSLLYILPDPPGHWNLSSHLTQFLLPRPILSASHIYHALSLIALC